MTEKTCTFIGHRDAPDSIAPKLETAIDYLITEKGVTHFYVGHNGRFDLLAEAVLSDLCLKNRLTYNIVLAYMPRPGHEDPYIDYTRTIYPDGLETVPPRFAIYNRNLWMLNRSGHLIAYTRYGGNAANFLEMARRKNIEIINLYE